MNKQTAEVHEMVEQAGSTKLLWILMLGIMAPLFDTTITNVAIDTLVKEFKAPVSTIQWVMTGYLLALAMVIPLTGWAVERFGGRRTWLFSLGMFFLGSVLCSMAWSVESLLFSGSSRGSAGAC